MNHIHLVKMAELMKVAVLILKIFYSALQWNCNLGLSQIYVFFSKLNFAEISKIPCYKIDTKLTNRLFQDKVYFCPKSLRIDFPTASLLLVSLLH